MNKIIEIFENPEDISKYHPNNFKPVRKEEHNPYAGTLGKTEWEIIAKIIMEYNQNEYNQQDKNKRKTWEWLRLESLPKEYNFYAVSMIDEGYLEGNEEDGYMLTVDALEKIKAKHPAKKTE